MAMTENGTWDPKNPRKLQYTVGAGSRREPFDAFPGLYWYSGFGLGELFMPDGRVLWGSPTDAKASCREGGVKFAYVDSFDHFKGTYLGD